MSIFERFFTQFRQMLRPIEQLIVKRPAWLGDKVRFHTDEQVEQLFQTAPRAALGTLLAALLFGNYVWYFDLPIKYLIIWSLLHLVVAGLRLWLVCCYQKAENSEVRRDYNYWLRMKENVVLLYAVAWSSPVWVLSSTSEPELIYVIMASLVGFIGASILHATIVFSVFVLFALPILLSFVVWGLLSGNFLYQLLSALLTLYAAYMTATAYVFSYNNYLLIQKSKVLNGAQLELIQRLSKAGEFRDNETNEHVVRMSYGCYLLALKAGFGMAFAESILFTSSMHDIGKIGIPDSILLKPGRLDDDERVIMQRHVFYGKELLQGESTLMRMAANIAGHHHESWDGSGYPDGLKGEEIPVEARITTICDVFDALISERPYKKAWSNEKALDYIAGKAGTQFDPKLVEYFMAIVPQIVQNNEVVNRKVSSITG